MSSHPKVTCFGKAIAEKLLNNNHSFTRSHLPNPNPNHVSSNYAWKERHLVMVDILKLFLE